MITHSIPMNRRRNKRKEKPDTNDENNKAIIFELILKHSKESSKIEAGKYCSY